MIRIETRNETNAISSVVRIARRQLAGSRWWQLPVFTLVILVIAAGCARTKTPQACKEAAAVAEGAHQPEDRLSLDAWRADLRCLVAAMAEQHPNLFHSISEQEFRDAVDRLNDEITKLTDYQIVLEMSKLVAMVSQDGRDGHTHLHLQGGSLPMPQTFYPIRLYGFEDGIYVIDTQQPYQDLIGARLLAIDGVAAEDIYARLAPAISHDNEIAIQARIYDFFSFAQLLNAAGITTGVDEAEWTLESANGEVLSMLLRPIAGADYWAWAATSSPLLPNPSPPESDLPLYLQGLHERFWFTFLADSNTLYIQYNEVRKENYAGETMAKFSKRIQNFVAENEVKRVIMDVRHNHGGDNTTYGPLIDVLSSEPINQPGTLFIVTSRETFSAAGNFATDIERQTNALFVGEPMGTSPNQFGDAEPIVLPNSGLTVSVSTRYHQFSDTDDLRLTIVPDIPASLKAADYFANQDPALKAILAYENPKGD